MRRVFEIKELCDIDVIAGADDVLFEMLVDGAVGWFVGYPNAFPEAVELYDLCVSGKWQERARCTNTWWRCSGGTPARSSSRPSSCRWTSAATPTAAHPAAAHPADPEQHAQVTADTQRALAALAAR